MKNIVLLFILCGLTTLVLAQTKIELKDVSKHVGDSVKVEGKIFGVKTFPDNKNAPTLLNLGADFPNQLLAIAVFDSYKSDTILMPTPNNKGDIAVVTEKIELYRGKPQIVVRSTSQLQIVSGEVVAPVKQ